jgi:hypothetical protein
MINYEADLIKLILLPKKSVYKDAVQFLDEPIPLMKGILQIILKSCRSKTPP